MRKVVTGQVLSVVVLGVMASGCHANLSEYSGNYTGTILTSNSGQSFQEKVSVRAFSDDPKRLTLDGHSNSRNWEWQISVNSANDSINLKASGDVQYDGNLHKKSNSNCFESSSIHRSSQAKICLSDTHAEFEVKDAAASVILNLGRPYGGSQPALEDPANYTSIQLRERARLQNFSSRLEFEKLISAKLNVRLRYLNLLPHFSVGSTLAVATYSGIPGLMSSIGDLAPFLLPSRWIDARESSKLVMAQQYSLEAMQLNAMQIAEGMSMVVGRDNYLHAQLKSDRDLNTQIAQEVLAVEQTGRIAPGSSLAIQATGNALDQVISSLESQIALELTDLAQAAGFINPSAIASLSVQPLGDISNPPKLILEQLRASTVRQSPELFQLDALIASAKLDKTNRGFQWLDPSGDPRGGIGAALPTYIEIGSSNVRQLLISKEETNSTLLRKVTDSYNDYLGWLDSYKLAVDAVNLQLKRIEYARQALQSGFAPSAVEEIREAIEQLSVNHVNLITAEYAWYVSISRIQRLVRSGPYQKMN